MSTTRCDATCSDSMPRGIRTAASFGRGFRFPISRRRLTGGRRAEPVRGFQGLGWHGTAAANRQDRNGKVRSDGRRRAMTDRLPFADDLHLACIDPRTRSLRAPAACMEYGLAAVLLVELLQSGNVVLEFRRSWLCVGGMSIPSVASRRGQSLWRPDRPWPVSGATHVRRVLCPGPQQRMCLGRDGTTWARSSGPARNALAQPSVAGYVGKRVRIGWRDARYGGSCQTARMT
jgi:hypothetical protein